MFPFKTILGPNLAARTIERQKTEAESDASIPTRWHDQRGKGGGSPSPLVFMQQSHLEVPVIKPVLQQVTDIISEISKKSRL